MPYLQRYCDAISSHSRYWAAGFSFSRGHFVVTTPYDFYQPMIFQGEEMSIGIRGWTIGYDYYAFERVSFFLWHLDLSETWPVT